MRMAVDLYPMHGGLSLYVVMAGVRTLLAPL
jgi:hypothetical protein